MQTDLNSARQKSDTIQEKLLTATTTLDEQIRAHRIEIDDARRDHRNEIDQLKRDHTDEVDRLLRLHRDELRELERRSMVELEDRIRELEKRDEAKLDEEKTRRLRDVQDLEAQISSGQQNLNLELQQKDLAIQNMRAELESLKGELDRVETLHGNAQKSVAELKETMQKTRNGDVLDYSDIGMYYLQPSCQDPLPRIWKQSPVG